MNAQRFIFRMCLQTVLLTLPPFVFADHDDGELVVDDDSVQCPNAQFSTIQSAVATAPPGATILVCEGLYTGSVPIVGPANNGLRLKAEGELGEVILQAVAPEMGVHGFHFQNVSGVHVEGFTVRGFHDNFRLDGSHGNTLRGNDATGAGIHDGFFLAGSHGNRIEDNVSLGQSPFPGCGITLTAGSANNLVGDNEFSGNPFRGAQAVFAGPGNVFEDNEVRNNTDAGIFNFNTPSTRIEDNDVHDNQVNGIAVVQSNNTVVEDNEAFGNNPFDIFWDTTGTGNVFEDNDCAISSPLGLCEADDDDDDDD